MVLSTNNQSSIMFTDMVGYSRITSRNESHALQLLDEHNNIIISLVKKYKGTVIKLIGDSVFAHFGTSESAAFCAMHIQKDIQKRNKLAHKNDHFHVRIGLHKGQFIVRDDDLFGNDVNLGSRIEGIAPKDGIAVSELFFGEIEQNQNMWLREMGYIKLKNIITPQKIFKLYLDKPSYQKESDSELRNYQEEQGVNFVDMASYEENQIQSLAILYLNNLGKDEDDTLCYSISENMITDLKKISFIRSPSFNSVVKFKNSDLPLTEIARRLNVENIITGSLLKSGDKIKVSMEMISTLSGNISWSESWEGNIKYTGTLNGQIISSLLDNLELDVPEHITRYFTYEMTENADANQSYVKGKQIVDFLHSPEKLKESENHFIEAIRLDSDFVEAYAYLGTVYRWMYKYEEAEEKLELALKIAKNNFNEPGLATVYNHIGILYRFWEKHTKALEYFEKGLELEIKLEDQFSEGKILQNMANCYSYISKTDISEEYFLKALEIYEKLEEEHAIGNTHAEMGNNYKNRREYTTALEFHFKALGKYRKLGMSFNEFRVMYVISDTYEQLGMYAEVEQYIANSIDLAEEYQDYYSLGKIYSISSKMNIWNGKIENAISDLQEAVENFQLTGREYQSSFILTNLAFIYLEIGELSMAEKTFKKAERLSSRKKEAFHDFRILLGNQILQIVQGTVTSQTVESLISEYKSNIIDKTNYEYVWLLASCCHLNGDNQTATSFMKQAQDLIQKEAELIEDEDQRKSFLGENIINRKIFKGEYFNIKA